MKLQLYAEKMTALLLVINVVIQGSIDNNGE